MIYTVFINIDIDNGKTSCRHHRVQADSVKIDKTMGLVFFNDKDDTVAIFKLDNFLYVIEQKADIDA